MDLKLLFNESRDARFVGRRLISHYVLGPEEHQYNITAVRSVSQREDQRDAEESEASPPPGNDGLRRTVRGRSENKNDNPDSFGDEEFLETNSQHEADDAVIISDSEDDMLICEQCHDAVDSGYATRARRTWARGLDRSKFSTNTHIFMQMKKDAWSKADRYEPFEDAGEGAVSYTHLTLPTNREV